MTNLKTCSISEGLVEKLSILNEIDKPIYFVTGNHEYYSGAKRWLDETDRMGFTNLVNDNKLITIKDQNIALAGVNDYRAHQIIPSHRSNPQAAIKGINSKKKKKISDTSSKKFFLSYIFKKFINLRSTR